MENYTVKIEYLTPILYGFSRGATEARDFINEFNAKYADLNGSAIGFVGVFDTVASIGMANSINIGYNLDLNENSADRIVHITAERISA